jgi:hypothetical protein
MRKPMHEPEKWTLAIVLLSHFKEWRAPARVLLGRVSHSATSAVAALWFHQVSSGSTKSLPTICAAQCLGPTTKARPRRTHADPNSSSHSSDARCHHLLFDVISPRRPQTNTWHGFAAYRAQTRCCLVDSGQSTAVMVGVRRVGKCNLVPLDEIAPPEAFSHEDKNVRQT